MPFFDATQAALAAGETVALAILVKFDFPGDTQRLWQGGTGTLIADSEEWVGLGTVGSVSDMQIGHGDSASLITFMLSGVDQDIVALAREAGSVRGTPASIYFGFLSAPKRMLDSPFLLETGKLDVLSFAANGPRDRTVICTMESDFADRSGASFGRYSPRDQAGLGYPDDRGLDFVASMVYTSTSWPFDIP